MSNNENEKKKSIFGVLPVTTASYADSSKTCLTYLYANVKHPTKVSLLIFFTVLEIC